MQQSFINYRRFCAEILPIINDSARLWELPLIYFHWFRMQSFPKISNLKQRAFARAEKITRHNLVRFPILLSSEHKSVGKPKKSYYFWYSQQTSKTQILMFSSFFSFTSSSTLYPPRSLAVASLFCFFQHSQLR